MDVPAAAPAKVEQLEATVRSTSGSTSITYDIPRKVKILSDNKPHKVAVAEITFPLEFEYIVVPSKGANAYLKAKTINDSDCQLLEGEMNVFIDDFFVTTSKLQQTVIGDKINLFLGVDSGVKVNIKPISKLESTSSTFLTNKKKQQEIKVSTVITNNKNFNITVLVFQELPLAQDQSNIKIKKEYPPDSLKNVELDNSSVLRWTLQIPPAGTQKAKLHYTIEYPAENTIYLVKQDDARPVSY